MINELSDNDILNYLMTSDFNEGLNSEESIFLLKRFRNFYRIIHSKNENLKMTNEEMVKKIEELNKSLSLAKEDLSKSIDELESEKSRKLSWKERFFGQKIK